METKRRLTALCATKEPIWAVLADVWDAYVWLPTWKNVMFRPVVALGLVHAEGKPALSATPMIEADDRLVVLHGAEFPGEDQDLIAADDTLMERHGVILLDVVAGDCPHPEDYLDQALAAIDREQEAVNTLVDGTGRPKDIMRTA